MLHTRKPSSTFQWKCTERLYLYLPFPLLSKQLMHDHILNRPWKQIHMCLHGFISVPLQCYTTFRSQIQFIMQMLFSSVCTHTDKRGKTNTKKIPPWCQCERPPVRLFKAGLRKLPDIWAEVVSGQSVCGLAEVCGPRRKHSDREKRKGCMENGAGEESKTKIDASVLSSCQN